MVTKTVPKLFCTKKAQKPVSSPKTHAKRVCPFSNTITLENHSTGLYKPRSHAGLRALFLCMKTTFFRACHNLLVGKGLWRHFSKTPCEPAYRTKKHKARYSVIGKPQTTIYRYCFVSVWLVVGYSKRPRKPRYIVIAAQGIVSQRVAGFLFANHAIASSFWALFRSCSRSRTVPSQNARFQGKTI